MPTSTDELWQRLSNSLPPKSNLDECWLAHKPWLADKTHHYMAYVRWYLEPRRKTTRWFDRRWTWRQAYGSTASEAMEKLIFIMENL